LEAGGGGGGVTISVACRRQRTFDHHVVRTACTSSAGRIPIDVVHGGGGILGRILEA
jgi:hypothetical protein